MSLLTIAWNRATRSANLHLLTRLSSALVALSCFATALAQQNPIIGDSGQIAKSEAVLAEPASQENPAAKPAKQGDRTSQSSSTNTFRPLGEITFSHAVNLDMRTPVSRVSGNSPPVADISGYRPTPSPQRNGHLSWFNPLYFEDPNLERCGHHHGCLTDAVSAVRFFGRAPFKPYLMGVNPPHSCVRSLGDCDRCSSFGRRAYIPDPTPEAIALQAAATVGLVFAIP